MKKIILLTALASIFFSCNRENSEIETNNVETKKYNYVTLKYSNIAGTPSSLEITKDFYDKSKISLLNEILLRKSTYQNENTTSIFGQDINFAEYKNLFGRKNNLLNIQGKGETNDFYTPEPIAISNMEELKNISEENNTIKWNADIENPNRKVAIALINRSYSSKNEVYNIDDISYSMITDDTGEFKLPTDAISRFPQNTQVDIIIARQNQKYDEVYDVVYTASVSDLMPSTITKN